MAVLLTPTHQRRRHTGQCARRPHPREPGSLDAPPGRSERHTETASLAARLLAKATPGRELLGKRPNRRLPACSEGNVRMDDHSSGPPAWQARAVSTADFSRFRGDTGDAHLRL